MDRKQTWIAIMLVHAAMPFTVALAEPPDALKIAVWIRDLGADRFQTRQRATRNLICREAIDGLVRAMEHDDPEVGTRAAEILFAISQSEDDVIRKAGEAKIKALLQTDARVARLLRAARGNHQERAIQQLRGMGAVIAEQPSGGFQVRIGGSNRQVGVPGPQSGWQGGNAGLSLLHRFGPITILNFDLSCTNGDNPVTTRGLQHLEGLNQIESIRLPKCVTNDALRHLVGMAKLRHIEFHFSQGFDGRGLVHLAGLKNLERIDLNQSNATSESFRHLVGLPKLNSLTTAQVSFGNAGMKHVGRMSELTSLSLDNTRITDAGLADVAQLKKLTYLNLRENAVSDAGLKHLYGLRQLKHLTLNSTFVSAEGVNALKAALPQVAVQGKFGEPLAASDMKIFTDLSDAGAIVRRQGKLNGNVTEYGTVIDVYSDWWRGESLDFRQVAGLSQVQELTLRNVQVTAADQEFLMSLKNVGKVTLLNAKP